MQRRKIVAILSALTLTTVIAPYLYLAEYRSVSPRYIWKQDYLYSYDFSYRGQGRFTPPAIMSGIGKKVDININFAGKFFLRPFPSGLNETRIAARIRPSSFAFRVNNEAPATMPDHMDFSFTIDPWGRIFDLTFPQEIAAKYGNLLREILALSQVTFHGKGARSWQDNEFSLDLKEPVAYRLLNTFNMAAIRLEKKYAASITKNDTTTDTEGRVIAQFDADEGHLVASNGNKIKKIVANRDLISQDDAEFSLSFMGLKPLTESPESERPDTAPAPNARGYKSVAMQSSDPIEILIDPQLKRTLGDDTISTLLDDIEKWPSDDKAAQRLREKMIAAITLHPEQTRDLVAWLKNAPNYSATNFNVAMSVMNYVGHHEAQEGLREVFRQVTDPEWQRRLINYVCFLDNPEQETEDLLRDLESSTQVVDVKNAARVGLGTIAHQLRATDPRRTERIVDETIGRLASSTEQVSVLNNLIALGNIGMEKQIEAIAPYVTHKDSEIRYQALLSMRFVDSDRARSILISSTKSPDERERFAAVRALSDQTPTSDILGAFDKMMDTETDKRVIDSILKYLKEAARKNQDERVFTLVKKFAKTCGSVESCRDAEGILSLKK